MSQIQIKRITQANVYLESGSLLGQVEEINLPEIKFKGSEHKALGQHVAIELPTGIDKMEGKIKWTSFYADTLKIIGNPNKLLKLQIRGSLQEWEASAMTGEKQVTGYIRATVANFPGFTFKQHDNVDAESQLRIVGYKLEIDDKEIIEIDALANIHKVDGVDILANFRANLGI
jgi:P2 family phage contractile tail tube protein